MSSIFNLLNQFFTAYDRLIYQLPREIQFILSLAILVVIIGAVFGMLRHGHWIFVLIFLILFPSGWPAIRNIAQIMWILIKFFLVRININL